MNESTSRGSTSSELILNALTSTYKAQRDRAVAQLSVYINSHVGVAEHPNIVDDCAKLVREIADAEECIKVVNSLFVPVGQEAAKTPGQ